MQQQHMGLDCKRIEGDTNAAAHRLEMQKKWRRCKLQQLLSLFPWGRNEVRDIDIWGDFFLLAGIAHVIQHSCWSRSRTSSSFEKHSKSGRPFNAQVIWRWERARLTAVVRKHLPGTCLLHSHAYITYFELPIHFVVDGVGDDGDCYRCQFLSSLFFQHSFNAHPFLILGHPFSWG